MLKNASVFIIKSGQVANKLYQLSYISESIEQFAKNMLLAAVDHHISDIELSESGTEQRVKGEVSVICYLNYFSVILPFLLFLYLVCGTLKL